MSKTVLEEDRAYEIVAGSTARIAAGNYQINLTVDSRGQVQIKTYLAGSNEELDHPILEYRFDRPDID